MNESQGENVSDKSLQDELVELRKYVDWANYRLGELEQQEAARTTAAGVIKAPAPALAPAPAPIAAKKLPTLEELLTPARLAWAGGLILVIGLCFLVSYGIRQGWITPEMRIAMAAIVSVALGIGGFRLRERGDQGPVPMAMVAVSIAGLFATITAAATLYDMFGPTWVALIFASVVATAGAAVAIRWNSELLGALAFIGALIAPMLVEAQYDAGMFLFCFAAFAASMVVCAMKGWRLLLIPALLIATISAAVCLEDASTFVVITGWSLVWIAAQIGATGPRLRGSYTASFSSDIGGAGTVLAAAVAVATGGYFEIASNNETLATIWIVVLAAVHLLLAAATYGKLIKGLRFAELDAIIGASLLAIGSAMIFNGPALVIAWCLQAAVAAWCLARAEDSSSAEAISRLTAAGFIALATYQCLEFDAPPSLLDYSATEIGSGPMLTALASIGAIVAASSVLAWCDRTQFRRLAMAVGLSGVAYAAAIGLDGTLLVCVYCAGAAAITWFAHDSDVADEGLAGSLFLVALAILQTLQFEAPLRESLVIGLNEMISAVISLVAIAGAFSMIAWRGSESHRPLAIAASALTLLYLCSAAIINVFPPPTGYALNGSLTDQLSAGQQGQALVSAFWALIAFAAIIIGLRKQIKELRIGGLVLLMVAIGKIVFIDLANLDAAYRTISFIAVGGVLLAVAYAFQRLRIIEDPVKEPTAPS